MFLWRALFKRGYFSFRASRRVLTGSVGPSIELMDWSSCTVIVQPIWTLDYHWRIRNRCWRRNGRSDIGLLHRRGGAPSQTGRRRTWAPGKKGSSLVIQMLNERVKPTPAAHQGGTARQLIGV